MVSTSTSNLEEKFNRVRRNFCFYLDIQDHGLACSLSRRLQDMGLQQEVFLSGRVTHVVRDGAPGGGGAGAGAPACSAARARASAMVQRARQHATPHRTLVVLTVPKAISLLDKLYDTFFAAPRKAHVRLFNKHYIKIEFLDKVCRPVFKEFDEWPVISLEPDPKRDKTEATATPITKDFNQNHQGAGTQKMTRKSRPRIKVKEEKEPKGGFCEMCNTEYVDAALHRLSPHHLAFVRDHNNFLALDTLIGAGADVETFLNKAAPFNGERRSLRKMCNGDVDTPKKCSKPSQSPDSTVNGDSPKRNGGLEDDKKHNKRCSKRNADLEDRQYYKVVGVSTKLRSSGGFLAKKKESPPQCNGTTNPLVVKFRKVRRSELSVLSDEAEQFMFPKRASSTSSTSSDDDEKECLAPRRKTPTQPSPSIERRRLARPVALKEESSEEDIWPEHKKRRKRRIAPVMKRRKAPVRRPEPPPEPEEVKTEVQPQVEPEAPESISPLREELVDRCMKWEDGRLKYTPAVEQLEFAFESVPQSEPWYEAFKRQDEDKVSTINVPEKFALYTHSPKLPYEIGQLPPLKPNCCRLSDLVKREDKPGPSRSYGTRGMKKQKFRKRTAATNLIALEGLARKSPREHASTLAILGSVGLMNRRKNGTDDTKSTASEDTFSDTMSNVKVEPVVTENQAATERLQQFLSEVFEDAEEFEVSEEVMEGEAAVTTSTNAPDMSSLMSECEKCDLIRNEIKENVEARARGRRGKFKKKNKTGWPTKKKLKKGSRNNSSEKESHGRSSTEPPDEATQGAISEEDHNTETEAEKTVASDKTLTEKISDEEPQEEVEVKTPVSRKRKLVKRSPQSSNSEDDSEDRRKKKRAMAGLLLQPVVRVARVDTSAARRLRSAGKQRSTRFR